MLRPQVSEPSERAAPSDGTARDSASRWQRPRGRRPLLNVRSLRVQLAIGSVAVALAAVLVVALVALLTVALSFHSFRRAQLTTEVSQLALALGRSGVGQQARLDPLLRRSVGEENIWLMDTAGTIIVQPPPDVTDVRALQRVQSTVVDGMKLALQGQASDGPLPGTMFPALSQDLYAVAPVRLGGTGPVIGAVALSTPARPTQAFVFTGAVDRAIFFSTLAAVLLSAIIAFIFSERLTRPLARLRQATAQMARGDYATRVQVGAPEELQQLGEQFNEMAAALQRDVSELRRQEQLRRELVANVSHELATPLTAIQGFTEALLDEVVADPAERQETIRTIAREAGRLRRLVDQLRQMARYEAGAVTLDLAPLRLPAQLEETLAVLAPEAERKRVTVRAALPEDLPLVLADADRLTEILLNVLDNALRHTPEGGEVLVDAAVAEAGMVRVRIADTGPGVPPEERERVFERFYRSDPSRSTATGGSGLGLAIVRALVQAHGGRITLEERAGGGAQFVFTLPIAASQRL